MGTQYNEIQPKHQTFIEQQHMFFVATAAAEGRVNLSPKGIDSLRVVNERTVVWLNLTGSGNETAAHLLENDRMTIMFCSFDSNPLILRLYGHASAHYPGHSTWDQYIGLFPSFIGARQIFVLDVDLVQGSCGFAVPRYEFVDQRDSLIKWAEHEGEIGLMNYRQESNQISLDGKPTGLPESMFNPSTTA